MVEYPDGLEPLLDLYQFRLLCPNLSATDEQVDSVLSGVSAAIRAYCGWHVAPKTRCVFTGHGEGSLLMLPAMAVSQVDSLDVNGENPEYEWHDDGMVRLKSGCFPKSWRSVVWEYEAGFDGFDLAQAVAQIASNAIVAAPGVSSEHAGNISISYNKTGDGITGGVSLLDRDRALLAPYKLVRV